MVVEGWKMKAAIQKIKIKECKRRGAEVELLWARPRV